MKATEQYFPAVLFITLYKVVRTFESVHEIFVCSHSHESYWSVLFGSGVCNSINCDICSRTLAAKSMVLVLMGAVLNIYCSVMDRGMPSSLSATF